MAPASPSRPPPIDLDDDGFDWEAAVREIDAACQISGPTEPAAPATTSGNGVSGRPTGIVEMGRRPSGGPRQSTLDRFVGRFPKCRDDGGRSGPVLAKTQTYGLVEDGNFAAGSSGDGHDGGVAVEIDIEAAKTWIYPINVPPRKYQLDITKKALFSNTLVALPTGLGKTLIAAVVMFNYFRWFPEGKIVFAAPSRPLVLQQIEACHDIVGIPQEMTIDMTGQISPSKRSKFWHIKRVFFVTPQVLEKDIQSGICLMKQMVCLVIDEAHRASGNFSYCVAVRELMAVPVQLRILALTATPGSKQQTIQSVIDNLHISTLEYRNEADHDVSPYVHDRKHELIEVPMGKDAVGINELILEAMRPFVNMLCAKGSLYNRDSATLSPCELLNSREKFRAAHPNPEKHREVEGAFFVLITLCHIRKLLSSHGIRPAYEMLEEKLQNGSIAKLSGNKAITCARDLMMKYLSHGAPSPKLEKMIQILTDHFKSNNPRDSRVIIFSNFRGSVKDIMNTLSQMGDTVKAAEFIGQSSGKTLKGQSQKVQQAVLQNFRVGVYNVIVATSIGEEGLDIMEVDLVICFDANVSPLRMIQRMGRTGRKHDGRVVVLACEGHEVKGYLRKQANSKAIKKHMHDGGLKSFSFHPSPRMVPHICRPEVQYVELSIDKFVPRGKKMREFPVQRSPLSSKLGNEENDLIMRYFHESNKAPWKPSLIAFPHFQAFPSTVHRVRHSFRATQMFIDSMRYIQRVNSAKAIHTLLVEVNDPPFQLLEFPNPEFPNPVCANICEKDSLGDLHTDKDTVKQTSNYEASPLRSPQCRVGSDTPHATGLPQNHQFLFSGDFVAIDSSGTVIILTVPTLPMESMDSRFSLTDYRTSSLDNKQNTIPSKASVCQHGKVEMMPEAAPKLIDLSELGCMDSKCIVPCVPRNYEKCQEVLKGMGDFLQPQLSNLHVSVTEMRETENIKQTSLSYESMNALKNTKQTSLSCQSTDAIKDMELSPRLTDYIEKGVVPESPVAGKSDHPFECVKSLPLSLAFDSGRHGFPIDLDEYAKLDDRPQSVARTLDTSHKEYSFFTSGCMLPDTSNLYMGTSSKAFWNENVSKIQSLSNMGNQEKEICTPTHNNSTSDNWLQNQEEVMTTVEQKPKYRRLRKCGDITKNTSRLPSEEDVSPTEENLCQHMGRKSGFAGRTGDGDKEVNSVKLFIEDEAEVSADADVSEDEKYDKADDAYEDSFIDDRINLTEASPRAGNSGNMMAFYRRSLLTQSPMETSPCYLASSTRESESKSLEPESCSSVKISTSLQTPQSGAMLPINELTCQNSVSHQVVSERSSLLAMAEGPNGSQGDCSTWQSRKRKLSFQHPGLKPVPGMQPQDFVRSVNAILTPLHFQSESADHNNDILPDDDFYKGLDFDALEAEAIALLRKKSETQVINDLKNMPRNPVRIGEDLASVGSPSFDLGI